MSKTTFMKSFLLCGFLITFSVMSYAGSNPLHCEQCFTGTVTDASSGKPMQDVVIVAKSTSLAAVQKVVTDEQGQFMISSLPTGTYTLRFEKSNYKPVEKRNMIVKKNTVKLNIELLPDESKEEDHHNWLLKIY